MSSAPESGTTSKKRHRPEVTSAKVLRLYRDAYEREVTYDVFLKELEKECGYDHWTEALERFKRFRAELRSKKKYNLELPALAGDPPFREDLGDLIAMVKKDDSDFFFERDK